MSESVAREIFCSPIPWESFWYWISYSEASFCSSSCMISFCSLAKRSFSSWSWARSLRRTK